MSPYYRRQQAPPLPPPESLPFPGNMVRLCSSCDLRSGCLAPVPGDGSIPSRVMLVGEAPGFNEDQWGKPFIGPAGIQLESLLSQAGIPRDVVFLSNTVRCRPPGNATPKPSHIAACAKWLDIEIDLVDPDIIVVMGAPAILRFLGQGCGTVEHLHAKPIEMVVGSRKRIILPSYHPAAALHSSTLLRQLFDDFRVLRGLVKGNDISEFNVRDEYPNPVYKIADNVQDIARMKDEICCSGEFGVDTETVKGNTELWSVQYSANPGTAWFIPIQPGFKGRIDLTEYDATAILHNYLFDVNWLKIADDRFLDSMTMAYLLGLPQGLKELASRICGINMVSYREMVRPGQRKISIDYLTEALTREWPDPPDIEETKWDNKVGKIVTRIKKPWHISRKIKRILADSVDNLDVDPYDRWLKNIDDAERTGVEVVLGRMPESSLADIKVEDAIQYAAKDADATLRVKQKMDKLITQMGLDFVLHMDTGILPMVNEMMRNGMAVDINHFRALSVEYDARMRAKSTELASLVGRPFNPNSRPQVASVVYGDLGFKPTGFTPTKEISTDDQELKKTGHPVAKGIIEYRRLSKIKGTYADNLAEMSVPDESGIYRIHTTLKTTRVETGRLSCVPLDAEILTNLGWKRWYEIGWKTDVLGYNIAHNAYEWTKVRHVHRGTDVLGGLKIGTRRRKEEMVYCTPNHKWVVGLKQSDRNGASIPDLIGISGAGYLGDTRQLTPILQLDTVAPPFPAPYWTITQVAAGIIGWAITDGHIISTSSKRRALSIRLRKKSSIQAVENLLENGKITYTRNTFNGIDEDFYIGVDVFEPLWSVFFDELGPEQYVIGLSQEAKQTMFDAMMEADGNVDEKHNRWSKGSGSIARTVMEILCLMLGKRFTSRYYSTHGGAPMQEIHFLGQNRYASNVSYRVDSDTMNEVWCPETELGTWVMRQGRHITITGNSADPNLQNIPVRSKDGKRIREGFTSPPGKKLGEGDLSQIEMCTQAHLANCKGLIDVFLRNGDPHTETAAKIFGVPLEDAKQEKYRYPTKRANFGVIYLIGPEGLSDQIQEYIADLLMEGEPVEVEPWDVATCEKYIADWYKLYPEVKDYQMDMAAMARRYGYVKDLFGRIRYIPEVSSPIRSVQEAGLRQAANMPVTATAQGVIKLAMGALWRELPKTAWANHARWLMQIHDSLLVEITDDDKIIKPALTWMRDVMCGVVKLRVPVKVDFKVGSTWSSMEKYELETK